MLATSGEKIELVAVSICKWAPFPLAAHSEQQPALSVTPLLVRKQAYTLKRTPEAVNHCNK